MKGCACIHEQLLSDVKVPLSVILGLHFSSQRVIFLVKVMPYGARKLKQMLWMML